MKAYLKRTALYFAYMQLALMVMSFTSWFPMLLLRATVWPDMADTQPVQAVIGILFTIVILFILYYREGYETRRFSLRETLLSVIPIFTFQFVYVYVTDGSCPTLIVGMVGSLSDVLFPNMDVTANGLPESEWLYAVLVALVIHQLLVCLMPILSGLYVGYKRRKNEVQKLQEINQVATE